MKNTASRPESEHRSLLVFGAGRIGRSFIGQLFGTAGYSVVFADVDRKLVNLLNERKTYNVVVKGQTGEVINVTKVSAVDATDRVGVIREVENASLIAVCVGKNALPKVIPLIADGLSARYQDDKSRPVDVIIAENMRNAAEYVRQELKNCLPENFPIETFVGLVETSIGKMVPIMTQEEVEKDPLAVFAEPYNQLIVDKKGFLDEIPDIPGLAPKENIKAWVDRKAFIHNLGHAAAAYAGNYFHPEMVFLYEVLEDSRVYQVAEKAMIQAADMLCRIYADEFTKTGMEAHIDDLLERFRNQALGDTVFRVGQDRIRKLGADDRFFGAIRLCQENHLAFDHILDAMSYAFFFQASGENGYRHESDLQFNTYLQEGIHRVLGEVCGLDAEKDSGLIKQLEQLFLEKSTCFPGSDPQPVIY